MIKGFKTFCKFNFIDDESILFVSFYFNFKACNHFEYMHIKKDEMIYKQGSKSEFFYGIINGKVGVLKKKVIGADPNQQHVSFNSPAKQQVDRSIRRSTTIKFQRQGTLTVKYLLTNTNKIYKENF